MRPVRLPDPFRGPWALRSWPLKEAGTSRDPSPDLVPRPPSPLGEGCGPLGAPPRTSIIALSLGERGDRKAEGAPRFASCGGEGSPPPTLGPREIYSRSCRTSTASPAEPGGPLNGLGILPGEFVQTAGMTFCNRRFYNVASFYA